MTQPSDSDQPGVTTAPWYRWYALAVLVLVFTSSHVDRQIMGILLEPIKHDLNASDTQMGFLIGLTFALFYATLGMPIAMLADRGNRRNIITWAITIWSGMTVLCGYAQSFAQLAITRIGVGIGEAVLAGAIVEYTQRRRHLGGELDGVADVVAGGRGEGRPEGDGIARLHGRFRGSNAQGVVRC